ncbi:hypothetical protein [Methylocucumis oryzae]|nr:hypothetical protein [Methylocucumis oryzae]
MGDEQHRFAVIKALKQKTPARRQHRWHGHKIGDKRPKAAQARRGQ